MKSVSKVALLIPVFCLGTVICGEPSIARIWNEELLDAIRIDYPAPTVHSRNLFHLSAAMYDVWRAYGNRPEVPYLVDLQLDAADAEAARREAISYAAYRILSERFTHSPNAETSKTAFDIRMADLGYDTAVVTTQGDAPAAVGNRIAEAYLGYFLDDGSNEANGYVDSSGYVSLNPPLVLAYPGTGILYPNHWQPLSFGNLVLQNGIVVGESTQDFLGAHWGDVWAFSLEKETPYNIHDDPGPPPWLGGVGDEKFRAEVFKVISFSNLLDPDDDVLIDIGPASNGNNPLGTNDGTGYPVNPYTGAAYEPNQVRLGDYGRVLAEFWADGPSSETPPGHWDTLANYVSDHPLVEKRIMGRGEVVDDLEWDIKLYFALNGAAHDAAIAAWDVKEAYDYVRPLSSIRYMGGLGQSSDPEGISYHPDGLPLIPGLIEVIDFESMAPGERHENLSSHYGEIAIHAWSGQPEDTVNQYSGTGWIRAVDWLPYQRATFVTPAFAGYVSGHSTFSRAGAEVLAAFTGDPYFPGGLGTYTAPKDTFLEFEIGPSETVALQWATYFDAADEAGISRLYGGIHVPVDDFEGRKMGSRIGKAAIERAQQYFNGLVITSSPKSQYLPPGNRAVVSVSARGSNLSYQWFRNGEPVIGASQANFDSGPVNELAYYHVEVSGDGGTVTSPVFHLSPTKFFNDTNLGGGNRYSTWFGQFNDLQFPLVLHLAHGWISCAFENGDGGWLYDYDLGWCWTTRDCYPFIYRLVPNEWLLYAAGTGSPAWYYSFENSTWFSK